MTPTAIALVLCAAVLHATWNALLKSGDDRFRSMAVMSIATSLVSLPAILLLPMPALPSLPYQLLSAALHVGYNLLLVRAYRHGDLGQVYPIARGSSPLLVTIGAALLASEVPGPISLLGIILVSAGVLSLAKGWSGASREGFITAFATGAFIAAYTVTDGLGARLSGSPPAYTAWMFLMTGVPFPIIFYLARGRGSAIFADTRETIRSGIGGVVSVVAYGAVIWAASIGPMGSVSALRETSVVFATLIGWIFLGERLTVTRLASCAAVAAGAIALASG